MTTALAPERIQKVVRPKPWTCRYCKGGSCGSCPGMILAPRNGKPCQPWFCECGKSHRPPYCHECKNERLDEVNPDTWTCIDSAVCYGRVEARRSNDPLWQMLQQARVRGALERKRKRLMDEVTAAGVDPGVDAAIEQLADSLAQLDSAKKARPKKPPRPKTGTCECGCKGTTKGGRFMVGHDAKLASALVARIRNDDDRAAYEEIVERGWLKKLPAVLRSKMEIR